MNAKITKLQQQLEAWNLVATIIELTDADDLEQAKIIKLGEDLIAAEKNRISELIYRDKRVKEISATLKSLYPNMPNARIQQTAKKLYFKELFSQKEK